MKRLLPFLLLLFPSLAVAQGQQITIGPFSTAGIVYVCPVPSGGTPCPSPSSIFSNTALTSTLANPFSIPAQTTVTFYTAPGQYTIEMPASSVQQIVGGGGGVAPNLPLPANSSGPGPVFNVKNYGAVGNAKQSQNGNGTAPGLTCTDCNFTSADVGKNIGCASSGTSIVNGVTTTIASIVSSTSVTINPSSRDGNGPCIVSWGTPDDTAVANAVTAWNAVVSASCVLNAACVSTAPTAAPVLYFPSGRYYLTAPIIINTNGVSTISGDQAGTSASSSQLFFANKAASASDLLHIAGLPVTVKDLFIEGSQGNFSSVTSGFAVGIGANAVVDRLSVHAFGNIGGIQASGAIIGYYLNPQNNNGIGFKCIGCSGEVRFLSSGNNNQNVLIQATGGIGASEGFKVIGGLVDECGADPCTQVDNSSDVWFIGSSLYGTPRCLGLTGNSFVHWDGGICGPFAGDINSAGLNITAGSILQASDVRFASTGTATCITNSGQFNDNGGNTCESQFRIASGTSTGTTAVLTLTTAGANVNTNCSVGDALAVESAAIAGYNGYYPAGATTGITAVTATTLTYTTSGSNLGALGAGGFAHCRNLQAYSGNLPKALLNNPIPNTCYVTGTFAATVTGAPMCNFVAQSATNISRITASSTTVTACTVAPVVTISDGTVSQTLTITTAKSQWDSAVDASTGVGTTKFKPNGTLQVTNTAGTCTTPPTNFSVSYNISPILSN